MTQTSTHVLDKWKPYLAEEDYEYLISYVEKCKNNLPNHKLLLLFGEGGNGKSTLITEIEKYVDNDSFIKGDTTSGHASGFEPIVKIVHVRAIENYKKEYLQKLLRDVVDYGQSVIAEISRMEQIGENILDIVRIIKMEHRFV